MSHLRRTAFCRLLYTLLKVLEGHALIQLSGDPELCGHLTPSVLGIRLEETRTSVPALAAAYAALSLYCYSDHEIVSDGSLAFGIYIVPV